VFAEFKNAARRASGIMLNTPNLTPQREIQDRVSLKAPNLCNLFG